MQDPHSKPVWNTTVDERRQSTRFPKDPEIDSAVVWQQAGDEMLVGVRDESLRGICLVMADISTFKVGTSATIVYRSEVLEATVRRISPQTDGTFLVGFECG